MSTPDLAEPLKVGTRVRIRDSGYGPARVVEFRGALGPKGARIYRVRVRKSPRPAYVEVREDQLGIDPEVMEIRPKLPAGWDAARVKRLIAFYEGMTEDTLVAEDEAAEPPQHGRLANRPAGGGPDRGRLPKDGRD